MSVTIMSDKLNSVVSQPEDVALFKEHRSDPIVTHYLQQLTKDANQHKGLVIKLKYCAGLNLI